MAQINLNVTPLFQSELHRLMRAWNCRSKTEAIRTAVHESLVRAEQQQGGTGFAGLVGAAKRAPLNPRPRFKSHHDLWEG